MSSENTHKKRLSLWLRMITCSTLVEREIRNLLRENHSVTLPRFDLMAALEREPEGMTMGDLSKRLLVSNGNVTGVVERLHKEGLVMRQASPEDRRRFHVRLTAEGRTKFTEMATSHAAWIEDILGGIEDQAVEDLIMSMDRVKDSLKSRAIEGKKP